MAPNEKAGVCRTKAKEGLVCSTLMKLLVLFLAALCWTNKANHCESSPRLQQRDQVLARYFLFFFFLFFSFLFFYNRAPAFNHLRLLSVIRQGCSTHSSPWMHARLMHILHLQFTAQLCAGKPVRQLQIGVACTLENLFHSFFLPLRHLFVA